MKEEVSRQSLPDHRDSIPHLNTHSKQMQINPDSTSRDLL